MPLECSVGHRNLENEQQVTNDFYGQMNGQGFYHVLTRMYENLESEPKRPLQDTQRTGSPALMNSDFTMRTSTQMGLEPAKMPAVEEHSSFDSFLESLDLETLPGIVVDNTM